MRRRASLHNLGCKVNAYETEAMEQLLAAAGYEIVPFGETSDVCIINTCSVTNVADKKSRQMLHRAKAKNPDAVVVAAGCYVQAAAGELLKDGAVDIIIGNNKKKELVSILEEYFQRRAKPESWKDEEHRECRKEQEDSHVIDIGSTWEYEDLYISRVAEHTRAFIKVQDGCNQFCSYCIIPYTRGRVRSRRPEDVEAEVRQLAASGYREVVLTGIHLSSYGIDRREMGEADWLESSGDSDGSKAGGRGQALLALIQRIHQIDGVERIRLGSLEPRIVTEEFARSLAKLPKVCPHFHLSLQSGCLETLKRMNRHYTPEEYLECCRRLRRVYDDPAITTDVIVGFPGETEEEFARTQRFLETVGFYEMHVFKYSRRKGTRADRMPEQVPEPVKGQRSDILLAMEADMSQDYRKRFLGRRVSVLWEEEIPINGETCMAGYTREYIRAAVSKTRLASLGLKAAPGQIVQGRLVGMLNEKTAEFEPEMEELFH